MTDSAFRSAAELAEDLRARRIGCLELLELYLGRAERLNPDLNAVVTAVAGDAAAGRAVALAGGPAAAAAGAVEARRWDDLPERVHLATLAHPGVPEAVTARFEDDDGRTVAEKPAFVVRQSRCSVAWARSRPAPDAPPPPERAPDGAGGAGADADET